MSPSTHRFVFFIYISIVIVLSPSPVFTSTSPSISVLIMSMSMHLHLVRFILQPSNVVCAYLVFSICIRMYASVVLILFSIPFSFLMFKMVRRISCFVGINSQHINRLDWSVLCQWICSWKWNCLLEFSECLFIFSLSCYLSFVEKKKKKYLCVCEVNFT